MGSNPAGLTNKINNLGVILRHLRPKPETGQWVRGATSNFGAWEDARWEDTIDGCARSVLTMTKTAALPPDRPASITLPSRNRRPRHRCGGAGRQSNGSGMEALRSQNFTPSPARKLLR